MDNSDRPSTPNTQEQPVEQVQPQAQQQQPTITMGVDDWKEFIKSTVDSVLRQTKEEKTRDLVEEYNTKLSEAVNESQASLLKPNTKPNEQSVDYVKRVIDEDLDRRRDHYQGKAYYGDKGEDFVKAKIIILKKMGLTEEEIAKELF